MRARVLPFASFLFVSTAVGCGVEAPPPEKTETLDAPIVNGQVDSGHPGVVALTTFGQAFCSGTLVTPTVVVTATHCIHPDIGVSDLTQVQVFFGTDVAGEGQFIQVADGKYNQDWFLDDPEADDDVAVLRLSETAPVAPIEMASLPPQGTQLTLVGFGITSSGGDGAGTKRVAHADIGQVEPKVFSMDIDPQGTCNGDSGGTALWNDGGVEKLVGIHTRSDCQTFMLDERVDVHIADFIQPFINQGGGGCLGDGFCAANCPSPDPDCPCAADGFCTNDCPNVASDPDCDPHCAADGQCAKKCPKPDVDCPICLSDDVCNPACSFDPDCDSGEGGSAVVGAGGADGEHETPAPSGCGGCAVPSHEDSTTAWLLGAGVAAVVYGRRKTGARRHSID